MSKKILFLLMLLLAVTMAAEQSLVPAMIVNGTDGSRQVVQLDATDISDLVIHATTQAMTVDIPEAQTTGVRSITFAMVAVETIPTSIDNTDTPRIQGVEKVMRDGQVIIRLQLQNGAIIEYDIHGNQITTK
ncbi:MAG: hypothetical protein IJS82_01435 [Paludibacteraceae bacterium]|nr:hypothetical protein [Paludibacteraceae bacterium]